MVANMLLLARGIEDDHYWVVEEIDEALIETPWRIEHDRDGYRTGHADEPDWSAFVYNLGPFPSPELELATLRRAVDR